MNDWYKVIGRRIDWSFTENPPEMVCRWEIIPGKRWCNRTKDCLHSWYSPKPDWLAEFFSECDSVEAVGMSHWCAVRDGREYKIPRHWGERFDYGLPDPWKSRSWQF